MRRAWTWGLAAGAAVLGLSCREAAPGPEAAPKPGVVEARAATGPAPAAPRPDAGTPSAGSAKAVILKPDPERLCPRGYRPLKVELETGGYALYIPEERRAPSSVLAQRGEDTLTLEAVEDFARFVRVRNEPEALRYVRFLDALQGALPGLDCFDPVKTPGEQLRERLHPSLTMSPERADSDLKLYHPPVARVDRARIRLSRQGPRGPFVVERYLACMPPGGPHRLILARETVGPRGEYRREEVSVLGEGDFN